MSLDLELNKPSSNIIQIGIVIGRTETGEILEKKHWLINISESIDPFITTLTTITQEMVDNGVMFLDAYNEIVELYKKHNCSLNFMTWGGGDHKAMRQTLIDHCKEFNIEAPIWEFGHREFDVKTIFLAFAEADGKKVRSGLAKSMTRVGLAFEGTKHWAPDDAYNTFRLYMHLRRNLPKGLVK